MRTRNCSKSLFLAGVGIWLWATPVSVQALIFPLNTEPYDKNHNAISFDQAYARGDAIGGYSGAGGGAIAPSWFITSAHIRSAVGFGYKNVMHTLERTVRIPNTDLALVKIPGTFPDYAELHKSAVRTGEVIRVYGMSAAVKKPVRDGQGRIKGWSEVDPDYRLRWGLGQISNATQHGLEWKFRRDLPGLGENCAQLAYMDSGMPAFLEGRIVGVNFTGSPRTSVRRSLVEAPEACQEGWLFDSTELYYCRAILALTQYDNGTSRVYPVYDYLPQIFAAISPRVNAGGGTIKRGDHEWTAWAGGRVNAIEPPLDSAIDLAGVADPAPAAVYCSENFLHNEPGKTLDYRMTGLSKFETYTLRFHFAGLFHTPESARQYVMIQGSRASEDFAPVAGFHKASVVEVKNVRPDAQGTVAISIVPVNGSATVSGVEAVWQRP